MRIITDPLQLIIKYSNSDILHIPLTIHKALCTHRGTLKIPPGVVGLFPNHAYFISKVSSRSIFPLGGLALVLCD